MSEWRLLFHGNGFDYRAVRLDGGLVLLRSEADCVTWEDGDARAVATAPVQTKRRDHALAALPDGRALAIGGRPASGKPPLSSCELFDPASRTWRPGPELAHARAQHQAVVVSGRVLVIGGVDARGEPLAGVEAWTPGDESWTPLPPMQLARPRPSIARLADGRVLVASGAVEIWDPSTEAWTRSPGAPDRTATAVAALRDGGALVTGGYDASEKETAFVDVLAPDGTWRRGADLPRRRVRSGAIEMPDGRIAIAGGAGTRSIEESGGDGGELDYEYRSFPSTWVDRFVTVTDAVTGGPGGWKECDGFEVERPTLTLFDGHRVIVAGSTPRVMLWTPPA